jgi:GNAT superfamily N-acetyltransferase
MPRSSRPRPSAIRAEGPEPPLRLRSAAARDLPTLVDHRRRMFREIGRWSSVALARSAVAYRRWARREIAAHRLVGFVVEDPAAGIVGSGVVWLQPAQPRPSPLARPTMPYIMSMYTAPRFRGRGVASALVRTMVRWASRRGYRRIFLHASKAGRPVYERLGFVAGNEMRLELPARRPRRR